MTNTKETARKILKEIYPEGLPTELYYKDHPLYGMLEKKGDLGGLSTRIPMKISVGQGRSARFARAQANAGANRYAAWDIVSANDYSVQVLDRKLMMEADSNVESFVKMVSEVIEANIRAVTESISISLFRDGSGKRAAVASISATSPAVITLENADDSVVFEIGQVLEAYSSDNVTARLFATASSTAEIIAMDRIAGTLTVEADNSGDTDTFAAGDLLFVDGDRAAPGAPSELLTGLQGWLPKTVSPTDSFFGQNRSLDRTRLAGIYKDFSDISIEEALIQLGRLIHRESGKSPDVAFMNDTAVAQLVTELGSKAERTEVKVGEYSWECVGVRLPSGYCKVVPDRSCETGEAYMLNMSTWALHHSQNEVISLVDEDGHVLSRAGTADAYETRAAAYAQLVCNDPSCNGRADISVAG